MEYCEAAAVTPTIELAKLALVTSRDEEEDEADKGGTDSSNDTDATLVDDAPSRFSSSDQSPLSPARSPSSVLGKRPRDIDRQRAEMEVDTPLADDFVMITSSNQPTSEPSKGEASSSKCRQVQFSREYTDGDIEMRERTPDRPAEKRPPIPPRKVSESVMMFGKFVSNAIAFYFFHSHK
jgi:ubiquitin carboxyl-terminal hydrolase 25/28